MYSSEPSAVKMKLTVLLSVLIPLLVFSLTKADYKSVTNEKAAVPSLRQGRIWPWLVPSIRKNSNEPCDGKNGTMAGFCTSRKECKSLGGTTFRTCGDGWRVCCSVSYTGENTTELVRVNRSHLISPQKLVSGKAYEYRLIKPQSTCQVQLKFIRLNISNADTRANLSDLPNNDCFGDKLYIVGAENANQIGPLCGNLTNQTFYLDYGSNNEIGLLIYLNTSDRQEWDIEVTYLRCDSLEKAPQGCLQYFTTARGQVSSFNWREDYNQSRHLNNEDYTICVKTLPGMNRITWLACETTSFCLNGTCTPYLGTGEVSTGDQCTTDWIMVLGENKHCGTQFPPDGVTSVTQPFIVNVHLDQNEFTNMDVNNTGFCMTWVQSP